MAEFKFGVTGQNRKELVNAISEILETKAIYMKTPTYAYTIGNINIDKNGTGTGEFPTSLLEELAERGFQAEIETPEAESEMPAEPEVDTIAITLPLDGWTPEAIDNLCKMVLAKEPLIEKALGVESIPIRVLENGIEFPWFRAEHASDMMAYAQFITALANTAKKKKRVTAKPQESFQNERFALRVWLIGLGLVGCQHSRIRQLLTKPLSGNGAWLRGAPDKAVKEAASEAETAQTETHAEDTPADAQPEAEAANVAADNADTGESVVADNA